MKPSTKIPRYCVTLQTQSSVYAASERQYTAAGKDVQVPRGGIYVTSDGRWSAKIDTRISVVGTSLQQNGFNKEIYKDKICETMDNTYDNLSIEMPKAQSVWNDKNDLWTWLTRKH